MSEVFFSWSFWLPVGAVLLVVFMVAAWLVRLWSRGNAVTLNWNAFSAPLNTAITVAGIVLPLNASFIAYSTASLGKDYADVNKLFVSAAMFLLAVVVGLWTAFGLATAVSGKDGTFEVTASKNTHYPAFLVAQLLLLLAGFVWLLLHASDGLPIDRSAPSKDQLARQGVFVVRSYPSTGMSPEQVRAMLGAPGSEAQPKSGVLIYYYLTHNAELKLTFQDGIAVEMVESKRNTK
jgi:hypothetical protein